MKVDQLKKLRELRQMKADQAMAALAAAQQAQSHWSREQAKWTKAFDQARTIGSAVIEEVMEEARDDEDPYMVYQKIQETLRRHRQMMVHANHRKQVAISELGNAEVELKGSAARLSEAQGRKEATGKLVEKVVGAELRREEAAAEDLAIDDFAARQFLGEANRDKGRS